MKPSELIDMPDQTFIHGSRLVLFPHAAAERDAVGPRTVRPDSTNTDTVYYYSWPLSRQAAGAADVDAAAARGWRK